MCRNCFARLMRSGCSVNRSGSGRCWPLLRHHPGYSGAHPSLASTGQAVRPGRPRTCDNEERHAHGSEYGTKDTFRGHVHPGRGPDRDSHGVRRDAARRPTHLRPAGRKALAAKRAESAEYKALNMRGTVVGIVEGVLVALILVMMIFKPGL